MTVRDALLRGSPATLLAIDTATEQCSVALLRAGEIVDRCVQTPRGHADMVLPMVQAVMAEADVSFTQLDAIAFGRGPGAFTGVRIAIGVAQGLAYACNLPLLPISNLATVAQQGADHQTRDAHILVCMDARMGEVYSGLFTVADDGLVMSAMPERVCSPGQVQVPPAEIAVLMGTGVRAYAELAERYASCAQLPDALPRAHELVRLAARDWQLGLALSAELAAPVYLRDQVAHVKAS